MFQKCIHEKKEKWKPRAEEEPTQYPSNKCSVHLYSSSWALWYWINNCLITKESSSAVTIRNHYTIFTITLSSVTDCASYKQNNHNTMNCFHIINPILLQSQSELTLSNKLWSYNHSSPYYKLPHTNPTLPL